MKYIVQILRYFVGLTFVFSGFVKLVDPLGSAYKFEEYFADGVLNMEFLIPYALPFSIVLILIELLLGICLIIGYKSRFTTWSILLLTGFFLFLTWFSAYYDKVTDCGCFGDAITLTPWETFYKNVILIVMAGILVWKHYDIIPWFGVFYTKWIPFFFMILGLWISYVVLMHLPLIDFRAYAVGNDLSKGMETFGSDGVPLVHDFSLENSTEDLTEEILSADKVVLVVAYNLDISDENGFVVSKFVANQAKEKGYTVYGLTASSDEEITEITQRFDLPYEFLFCDGTTLKTIIRANPGIVLLNKGVVMDKKSWRDYEDLAY